MSNIDQATDPLHQHHHQHHHNASLTTTKSQYSCNTLPVNQAATRLLALSLRETAPTLIATVDLDSKAWVSNRYKDTSLYIFQNRNKHKEKSSNLFKFSTLRASHKSRSYLDIKNPSRQFSYSAGITRSLITEDSHENCLHSDPCDQSFKSSTSTLTPTDLPIAELEPLGLCPVHSKLGQRTISKVDQRAIESAVCTIL